MRTTESLQPIIEEVDYLLAERRQLAADGPHFIVTHGYHRHGTLCLRGETVEQVCLAYRCREFPLHLSPTGLLIVDCLCRYRRTSLTAARIAEILASDPFYMHHGANAHKRNGKVPQPSRASIKVHVQRIREQMAKAFKEAGLNIALNRVLISDMTDSNIVVYRLKAGLELRHRCNKGLSRTMP